MDFKVVTEKLLAAFKDSGINYALMGGFAMGLFGGSRSTVDIDFLVNRDDMDKVDIIMQKLGYECKHRSENVSQYISPSQVMGEVDFLHAFREASLEMLERVDEKEIFSGALKIKVLKPEDLIGLKVQAIKNDPSRKPVDMADIETLLSLHSKNLDWTMIKEYFKLFNMENDYNRLKEEYNENL